MEDIFRSPAFFDEKWLNTSCSGTSWKTVVSEKLDNAAKDINHILSSQNDNKAGILAHYYQTLSMDRVAEFSDSLKKRHYSPIMRIPNRTQSLPKLTRQKQIKVQTRQ